MRDELIRAIATWRKWHNPMSRRWVRAAIAEWRFTCAQVRSEWIA